MQRLGGKGALDFHCGGASLRGCKKPFGYTASLSGTLTILSITSSSLFHMTVNRMLCDCSRAATRTLIMFS